MNLTYLRAGKDWVAIDAQHDVVGVLKSFEDSWKIDRSKSLRIDPQVSTKVGD